MRAMQSIESPRADSTEVITTMASTYDFGRAIKFTGIVVTYNEARRLRECLNSLAFCDQLIVVDLGSEDESVEIARECGAEIVHHERVPVVEQVRSEVISRARNEWVVFADPDEVFPVGIGEVSRSLIRRDPDLGVIMMPVQNYFKGRPLDFTVWGSGQQVCRRVVHRNRNRFSPHVHRGMQLLEGYTSITLPREPANCLKHYWVDSYREMFGKHWRYIKQEGQARYELGERFWWRRWVWETRQALRQNLFDYGGLKGGFTGIFLSFFYAWYVCMSLLSLRRYQRRVERNTSLRRA